MTVEEARTALEEFFSPIDSNLPIEEVIRISNEYSEYIDDYSSLIYLTTEIDDVLTNRAWTFADAIDAALRSVGDFSLDDTYFTLNDDEFVSFSEVDRSDFNYNAIIDVIIEDNVDFDNDTIREILDEIEE